MKKVLRCIKRAVKISPAILPLTLLRNISLASLPFVSLYFAGNIVNILVAGGNLQDCYFSIIMLASLSLGCGIIFAISGHLLEIENDLINYKLVASISEKAFGLPYEIFEKQETRNLLIQAEGGAMGSGGIEYFFDVVFGKLIYNAISIIYSLILLSGCLVSINSENADPFFAFFNSPWSILVVFGAIGLNLLFTALINVSSNKISLKFFKQNLENNRRGNYVSDLSMSTELAKDIRVYQMEDLIMSISRDEYYSMIGSYKKLTDKTTKYGVFGVLVSALTLAISYLYISGKAYFGIIGVGSVITLVGAISTLANSLNDIIGSIGKALLMSTYLSYYFDYLDLPDEVEEGDPLPEGELVISFEHVSFRYPNTEVDALSDVSFSISPNKKTAIVGPNGAGKSTIIKLVSRLYKPTSGKITLNGTDINSFSKKEYGKLLAVLFQDFSLFPFDLGENVSSNLDYDEEKVKRCLDLAGFDMYSAPEGLKTRILSSSSEGKDFSGGEKQKIAIARALYKDSKFVLLDEPTSALDPKSELEVYTSISTLVNDKTSLFISHRMSSTKFCDEIYVLDEGKLVEIGNHESLIKKDGLYAKLFNEQAKYYQ